MYLKNVQFFLSTHCAQMEEENHLGKKKKKDTLTANNIL